MRTILAVLVASVIGLATLPAVTQDNWAKMTFTDGQARTIDDFAGRTVAVYAFCRG